MAIAQIFKASVMCAQKKEQRSEQKFFWLDAVKEDCTQFKYHGMNLNAMDNGKTALHCAMDKYGDKPFFQDLLDALVVCGVNPFLGKPGDQYSALCKKWRLRMKEEED